MSEQPKREAVVNRDGTDTLLNLQKRRKPAEVKRDKELAASAKAAAKNQKAAIAAQKKKRVAAFEDQLRSEDQQQEEEMSRPDLVLAAQRVSALFLSYPGRDKIHLRQILQVKTSGKGQAIPVKGRKLKVKIISKK